MSTFKEVKGISIKSEYFTENEKFSLFKDKHRVALVFGRNGSGKSTIAQGFIEYKDSVNPRTVDVKLLTEAGDVYISPVEKPLKIFVFNEDYINKNVKFKSEGLDTIVLLGEQIGLDEQIQENENRINDLISDLDKFERILDQQNDKKNSSCPEFWLSKIYSTLRERWAGTQGIQIKKKLQKSSVNKDVVEKISKITCSENKESIQREFDDQLRLFNSIDSESTPIEQEISTIQYDSELVSKSKKSLSQIISRPQLTDRESELLKIFGIEALTTAQEFVSNNVNKICPTCLNEITPEHKEVIVKKINRIISKESDDLKKELQKLLMNPIDVANYDIYKFLDEHLYSELISNINRLNTEINRHNDSIQEKINNPFEAIVYSAVDISLLYDELNHIIEKLERKRRDYNLAVQDRKKIAEKLLNLNDKIAYFEIKTDYEQYKQTTEEKSSIRTKLENKKTELEMLRIQLNSLESQKANLELAVESINRELKYIFYSSKKMELAVDDNTYKLKVNGQPVKPSKISSGERNALALCYFFTDISKNMDADNPYSNEMFLVIDDPVSSFDFENKIGIMSFLKYKLKDVLLGCETTKALILTHDVSFVMDFEKALEEIANCCSSVGKHANYSIYYLCNKKLTDFRYKKHNEYSDLLKEIYKYAKADPIYENDAIGNQMRKILEAFSTFSYKVGIAELSTNVLINNLLPSKQLQSYFENLMYRLVLNGESHTENTVRFLPDTDFYLSLSPEEKQRTARDILCLMFLLNKEHILRHIDSKGAEKDIKEWIDAIKA